MSHLDEGILHALLDGEVPSQELAPIQAHLAGCGECRARLAEEDRLRAEADGLVVAIEVPASGRPPAVPPADRAPRKAWVGNLAWAASLLLAVALGYGVRGAREPRRASFASEGRPADVTAAAAPPEAVPATAPAAPAPAAAQEAAASTLRPLPQALSATGGRARGPGEAKSALADRPGGDSAADSSRRDRDLAAMEERPAEAEKRTARGNVAAAAPATAQPQPAPPVAAAGAFERLDAAKAAPLRLNAIAASPSPVPIAYPEAVRLLGGSFRQIEGLVPQRLEALGSVVRVIYRLGGSEVVLEQELVDGRIVTRLSAVPPIPADSLERLRARVRE